jgi:hypothetical protein
LKTGIEANRELVDAHEMSNNTTQPSTAKLFRWLGSIGQQGHPESLRKLLAASGMKRLEANLTETEVEVLIDRLSRGDHLGSRRLRSIKTFSYLHLKELRWKLNHPDSNAALRLYLASEPLHYSGLRWQIKALEQDPQDLRNEQNQEILLAVIAFLENRRESN